MKVLESVKLINDVVNEGYIYKALDQSSFVYGWQVRDNVDIYAIYLVLKKLFGKKKVLEWINPHDITDINPQLSLEQILRDMPRVIRYKNTLIISNKGADVGILKVYDRTYYTFRIVGPEAKKISELRRTIAKILDRDSSIPLKDYLGNNHRAYTIWGNGCRSEVVSCGYNIMDSLVLKQKDEILHELKIWENVRKIAAKTGFPSTIGILLSGPSGTGKTTFVKALAQKYHATLYILDSNNTKINIPITSYYSYDKQKATNIIYIDEIDKLIEHLAEKEKTTINIEQACDTMINTPSYCGDVSDGFVYQWYNPAKSHPQLGNVNRSLDIKTLGDLYQLIDGPKTPSGTIFIATTNHPELLPEPLVRSGRLSLEYKFNEFDEEDAITYCEKREVNPDDLLKDVTYPIKPSYLEYCVKKYIIEKTMLEQKSK